MFQNSLHGLRGVAAFGVFLAHCAGGYALNLCKQCGFEPALAAVNNIGTFGVEIFFILSGYVITAASLRSHPIPFFTRRFWRLYPLLLLFTVVFFIGNYFLGLEPAKNRWDFLLYNLSFTNLLLGTPALTPNAWTITYEVMFYLLTYALIFFFLKSKRIIVGVAISLISLVFVLRFPVSLYFVLGVLTYWVNVSYKAHLEKADIKIVRTLEAVSILLVLIYASTETVYQWEWLWSHPSTFVLMASVFVFVNCLLTGKSVSAKLLEHKWMLYLGTISYSLYLAHPYSYLVTRMGLKKIELVTGNSAFTSIWVFSIVVFATTMVLSIIVHKYIEAPAYRVMTGRNVIGGNKGEKPNSKKLDVWPKPVV